MQGARRLLPQLCIAALLAACSNEGHTDVQVPAWAAVAPEQVAEARKYSVPVAFENDLGMRFVLIPAGTFTMGSPKDDPDRHRDMPLQDAGIARPYYLQCTEATMSQFRHFRPDHLGTTESASHPHRTGVHPAVRITPQDVDAFATWLSHSHAGRTYRLPTEEEWEYACRAGGNTPYSWGSAPRDGGLYANLPDRTYREWEWNSPWTHDEDPESLRRRRYFDTVDGHVWPAPVASFLPNAWGLYDMIGNVEELCTDITDRAGFVVRGGFAMGCPHRCRCASRDSVPLGSGGPDNHGFRLVSPLPNSPQ